MLRRVEFSSCGPRDWGDRPVAIVGGGTSLRGFDFRRLKDRFRILAVNGSMFDIPFADAGFSLDRRAMLNWWQRMRDLRFQQFYAVPTPFIPGVSTAPTALMRFMLRKPGTQFNSGPDCISSGGTSGFGALHLSYLKGAKSIVLFGFDYCSHGGNWHHNEQHYEFSQAQDSNKWAQWAQSFTAAKPALDRAGVGVINASLVSAITAFPKCSIEDALKCAT